jgi:hypothetical protein
MFSKREAADFLAVSVRSLERYTTQGRVHAHYRKGRGHPIPEYEEEDLLALKAGLEPALAPPSAKALLSSEPLSFRLDEHYLKRLGEAGQKRGISAGAYARLLVIDALEEGEGERLRGDMAELRRLVELIGEDLASATLALLVHGGNVEQEPEARDWVLANLRTAGGRKKE